MHHKIHGDEISVAVSCRLARKVGLARQLWHPVSAMAVVERLCVSSRKVCPCLRKSPPLWLIWRRLGSVLGGINVGSMTGMFGPKSGDGACPSTLCPPVRTRRFHALCSASTCGLSGLSFHMSNRWIRLGSVGRPLLLSVSCRAAEGALLAGVALEVWLP